MYKNEFMSKAIEMAYEGISQQAGGPFGCVIVKDNVIVGVGHNEVVKNNDPTSHGEIVAIRNACKNLGTFDLTGCELYTTGEPCPMCLCAIMWARIDKVYYSQTIDDAQEIGFDDKPFYEDMYRYIDDIDMNLMDVVHTPTNEGNILFETYKNKEDKTHY